MANENSGILDANALFGDLPWLATGPASSVPPPMPPAAASAAAAAAAPAARAAVARPTGVAHRPVVIVEGTAFATPRRRRDETTARSRRPMDPVRAQLIAVIVCGLIALAATLVACFFYVTAPPSTHARAARPAMTAAR